MANKYKHILIGLIVAITIGIFFFGLNYLKGKNYFIEEDSFYVVYKRIEGLTVSSPVLLNGYNVGQVREIKFFDLNKGNLIVKFVVEKDISIPKNSIAKIYSQDLMGTKAIELEFSDNEELLKSGDTLIAKTEESLKEQVSIEMLPLKNKAEDLLKEMEQAIKIIRLMFNERTRSNIQQIIEELNYTSSHLRSGAASLDTLLLEEKQRIHRLLVNMESISGNFSDNNDNITAMLNNMQKLTDSLSKVDFKGTLDGVDSSLIAFNSILTQVEKQQGTLGQLIYDDSLYNTLNRSSDYIGHLAEDLRVNPKRYLHFSVFDLGRTMYVLDKEKMKEEAKEQKPIYYVLLAKSSSSLALESFEKIENVKQRVVDDTYLYTVGGHYKKRKAEKFLSKVKNNYEGARLILINKGQYEIID